jgi:hypothetical protein
MWRVSRDSTRSSPSDFESLRITKGFHQQDHEEHERRLKQEEPYSRRNENGYGLEKNHGTGTIERLHHKAHAIRCKSAEEHQKSQAVNPRGHGVKPPVSNDIADTRYHAPNV